MEALLFLQTRLHAVVDHADVKESVKQFPWNEVVGAKTSFSLI